MPGSVPSKISGKLPAVVEVICVRFQFLKNVNRQKYLLLRCDAIYNGRPTILTLLDACNLGLDDEDSELLLDFDVLPYSRLFLFSCGLRVIL
jgi:hypothetical protein